MTTTAAYLAPAGLTESNEYPLEQVPDVENMSENYWFVVNLPDSGMGLFLHMARAPHPDIWRETTVLYLPHGEVLLSKGYGHQATPRGPAAGTQSFQCETAWNRWRIRFDGAAVRARLDELDGRLAADGIHIPVRFDLEVSGRAPVWGIGGDELADQCWADVHYQQLMDVRGTITNGDADEAVHGVALRDHSRGPRDYSPIRRHCALAAAFPSGRGFHLVEVDADDGRLAIAAVVDNGELHEGEVVSSPLLPSRGAVVEPYEFEIRWKNGTSRVRAAVTNRMTMGFAGTNEITLGHDPTVGYTALFEGPTSYTMDGEPGFGWTERSWREDQGR